MFTKRFGGIVGSLGVSNLNPKSSLPVSQYVTLESSRHMHLSNTNYAPVKDPYSVLGVSRTATNDEIKKQYRIMAKKYHPDLNKEPGAADKMAEVAAAYETLSDPQKRQIYDQTGMNPEDVGDMGASGGFANGAYSFSDFADLFGFMNGQMGGAGMGGMGGQFRNAPRRGADIQVNVTLSFMEAVNGASKEVKYDALVRCNECSGSGCKPGTKPCKCKACNGAGIRQTQRGPLIMGVPCNVCGGSGEVIECPCKSCKGATVRRETQSVTVDVPAGVMDGMELRLADHGHSGEKGGPRGHLFIGVRVEAHPIFQRADSNIHVTVPLPWTHPLLGGEIRVPTLEGDRTFDFPRGTSPDIVKKLKGKGIRRMQGGGVGDLFVHFALQQPKELTQRQIEILTEFRNIEEKKARGEKVDDAGVRAPSSSEGEEGKKKEGEEEHKEEKKGLFGKIKEAIHKKKD